MAVIPSDVRRGKPLHPLAEVPILFGPQNQVKMICHQTKGQQSHGDPLTGLNHQL